MPQIPAGLPADIHDLGVATMAALAGALGFRKVHAGAWPGGLRLLVEREGQTFVVEITPYDPSHWPGYEQAAAGG